MCVNGKTLHRRCLRIQIRMEDDDDDVVDDVVVVGQNKYKNTYDLHLQENGRRPILNTVCIQFIKNQYFYLPV